MREQAELAADKELACEIARVLLNREHGEIIAALSITLVTIIRCHVANYRDGPLTHDELKTCLSHWDKITQRANRFFAEDFSP